MSDRPGGWRRRWRDDRSLRSKRRVVDATLFSDYFADQAWTDQQIVDAGVFVSGFPIVRPTLITTIPAIGPSVWRAS